MLSSTHPPPLPTIFEATARLLGPYGFLRQSRPQGLLPAIQLREEDGVLMAPVPDRLAGDTHGLGNFTVGLAEDQEIDGVLLPGENRLYAGGCAVL